MLDTLEFCYFDMFFNRYMPSVATHCKYGGKYFTDLVANVPLSLTAKEFLKLANVTFL